MKYPLVELSTLMVSGGGSVDPQKYPEEVFELLSIPAFDRGTPDVVAGSSIGSSKQLVEPGDVMISKIVPHIRRSWVVPPSSAHRQIASGEWIVFRDPRIDGPYFRQLLVSNHFNGQFMQTVAGVGGSLLRARPAHVAKILAPLPSLDEQRRIAAILDKTDELRAKRREALTHLDALTESIFHDMFGDVMRPRSGVPAVEIQTLCSLVRGSSPRPQGDSRYFGGPIPRLMIADITRDGSPVTPRIDSLTQIGASKSRPVPAGTVVMAVSGNIGLTSTLAVDACIHDGFVGFLGLDTATIRPQFLQSVLIQGRALHSSGVAGAIFKNITTTDIKKTRVPCPPLHRQDQFINKIAAVERLKEHHRTQLTDLDALFASLQHRAFNGTL